ncbi:phage tail-collar fiber domain-containing protein, partial [Enterobacter cancerogenus]|uniref:phage tail-collar fiber domain-containing protein n=1 Tax=Enterobacter cancerogenus TaxID=69218 RepID=UPI001F18D98B
MAEKYYSILTNRGKELEAQSSATGKPVIIKDFVVGDGNGQAVKPDPAQTKLVREVYRNAISALQVSPDQANQFIAQLVLAAGVGGFVVREVGLLTDAGELYSVANCAAIEKPENGVSVNLQYRLAVSETANIELKVATGDGLFLRIDKNLSEIAAKGQTAQKSTREAIGVVDATTTAKGLVQLNSATNSTSETMAATPNAVKAAYDLADKANKAAKAANDNAEKRLLKDNNLTDVPDKGKARDALELKTAAIRDVTTSTYDTTAGRVLKVGDYGQGTANGLAFLNSIFDITCTGKYSALGVGAGATATPGMPANSANSRFSVEADSIYTNQFWVTLRSSKQIYVGMVDTNAKTTTWYQLYNTAFKPTAGDVGALPLTGGTLSAALAVVQNGAAITVQSRAASQAVYVVGKNYDGANSWYVGRGGANYNIALYNYKGGNGLNINEDGSVALNLANGKTFTVNGQVVPSTYANFDARYQVKGNYTPAGQAYTKAESNAR